MNAREFIIYVFLLLLVPFRMVYAGQTVDSFDDKALPFDVFSAYDVILDWADVNGHAFDKDASMVIEQTIESNFQLIKYGANFDKLNYQLIMKGGEGKTGVIDIKPDKCDFSGKQKTIRCPFGLTASRDVQDNLRARTLDYTEVEGESTHAQVSGRMINITVLPHVESGHIIVTGPNAVIDRISLVAASTDNTQDLVPFTVSLTDSMNISTVHLTISPVTPDDEQIATIKDKVCDLVPYQGQDSCANIGYPLKRGVANYVINGSWVSTNGKRGDFDPTPVTLNTSELYAGYENDQIHKKDTTYSIGEQYGVTGLTFNNVNNTMYALDGYHVFRQNVSSDKDFTPFITLDSSVSGSLGQVASLTNNSSVIMVGDGNGRIKYFDLTKENTLINEAYTDAPPIAATIDTTRNNTVFITTGYSVYSSAVLDDTSKHGAVTFLGAVPDYHDFFQLVGAYDGIFLSGMSEITDGSDIYKWNAGQFVPVITDNPSPFQNKTISNMFTPQDKRGLYVSGADGTLYKLAYPTNLSGDVINMSWTALNSGNPIGNGKILDAVIDDNNNIYLAVGKSGVWKVPYDGSPAFEIKGFTLDSTAGTVVLADPEVKLQNK